MYRITLAALCLAILSSCTSAPSRDGAPLTSADNGKAVTLSVGDPLVIRLTANHTTGYQWVVVQDGGAVLKQTGESEYQLDPAGPGIVGSGGEEIWRFKAAAAGEATLKLGYQRPWEKGAEPAQTYSVRVTVK